MCRRSRRDDKWGWWTWQAADVGRREKVEMHLVPISQETSEMDEDSGTMTLDAAERYKGIYTVGPSQVKKSMGDGVLLCSWSRGEWWKNQARFSTMWMFWARPINRKFHRCYRGGAVDGVTLDHAGSAVPFHQNETITVLPAHNSLNQPATFVTNQSSHF